MQETLKGFMESLTPLQAVLEHALSHSGYIESGDISSLEYDPKDPEQAFIADGLEKILYKLDMAYSDLMYLSRPIAEQGTLYKKENGRYQLGDTELTSGSCIEVLIYDEWQESRIWKYTRVEYNGEDYYLTAAPEQPLQGIEARIRERSRKI